MQNNDIEMYSTHIEEKPVVAERFMTTLTKKFINACFQCQIISVLIN